MAQAGANNVRIIMATHNGATFLSAQLQSFLDQDHSDWSLAVGDDGSRDETVEILSQFSDEHSGRKVTIHEGPRRGSAANFLTQTVQAAQRGDWIAFSDQDDVWMPHKISRAVWHIQTAADPDAVVAYAGRTVLTDPTLAPQGLSRQYRRPPGFRNALIQNVMAGNTVVLNPPAAQLVANSAAAAVTAEIPFHDWWVYLLVSGAGGKIILDDEPVLFYRQHDQNALGHHGGVAGHLARARLLANGTYSGWIDANLKALTHCADMLTPLAQAQLDAFCKLRQHPRARARVQGFRDLGLYRQTRLEDCIAQILVRTKRL